MQKLGWSGDTPTTYWFFNFDLGAMRAQRFHICQQRAPEIVANCHEILQIRVIEDLYREVVPPHHCKPLPGETRKANFVKYCLEMLPEWAKDEFYWSLSLAIF